MGKILIINGANFTGVSLPLEADVAYPTDELLAYAGYFAVSSDGTSVSQTSAPSSAWRCAILEIKPNMYIQNATAVSSERVADAVAKIPSIIFLNSNSVSGFIQGSEIYMPSGQSSGADSFFGTFSGYVTPPTGATHIIVNTNYDNGGSADSIISWNNE